MADNTPHVENENLDNMVESNKKVGKRHIFIIIAVVILGIILGVSAYLHSLMYVSTDDAFVEGHIVQIAPKISGDILKVNVDDNQKVKKGDLLFEIDPRDYKAKLEQAKAALQAAMAQQKGANVNVGLTSIVSNANVKQASSGVEYSNSGVQIANDQIAVAQSNFTQAQARVAQSRAGLNESRAAVAEARASAKLAQEDLNRYTRLYNLGAVSKQQLDTAVSTAQIANARLTSAIEGINNAEFALRSAISAQSGAGKIVQQAESQLEQAKAGLIQAVGKLQSVNTTPQTVAVTQFQYEAANAQMKQLRANLRQAELNLSYTKIYAPEAGQVTRKVVEKGAYFKEGQAALAIVPSKIWVVANFKETQLTKMRVGQHAHVKVDAYPGKVFKAHVDSIQRGTGSRFSLLPPENAVGSYVKVVQRVPVKLVFDEQPSSKYTLVPGMSVEPEVELE